MLLPTYLYALISSQNEWNAPSTFEYMNNDRACLVDIGLCECELMHRHYVVTVDDAYRFNTINFVDDFWQ
jgi:hypothetical protein